MTLHTSMLLVLHAPDSQWLDLETVQRRDAKMAPYLVCPSVVHGTQLLRRQRRPCLMQSLMPDISPAFLCHCIAEK